MTSVPRDYVDGAVHGGVQLARLVEEGCVFFFGVGDGEVGGLVVFLVEEDVDHGAVLFPKQERIC